MRSTRASSISRVSLICSEDVPWVRAFSASVSWSDKGELAIDYHLDADLERLLIPEVMRQERSVDLWQHTCFEAFVMGADAPAYREFNFSPSSAWQTYGFSSYRQGGPLEHAYAPRFARATGKTFDLRVLVPPADLPPQPLRLGLAAVLESLEGNLSYWALRHPPARPDFHHADGLVLELARP